ncbi:hypothetical protein Sjap_001226 [Stephania japonica]|uniref:Uncharacterized protein n=1 Tax=Stephania japonica TaxID=461633 RepID=A0AAP0PUU4_9MAGN
MLKDAQRRSKAVWGKARRNAQRRRRSRCRGSGSQMREFEEERRGNELNVFKTIEGKDLDITKLVASGREKLASLPSGGGGPMAVAASVGARAAAPSVTEPKREEKVEEKEESDETSENANTVDYSQFNAFMLSVHDNIDLRSLLGEMQQIRVSFNRWIVFQKAQTSAFAIVVYSCWLKRSYCVGDE